MRRLLFALALLLLLGAACSDDSDSSDSDSTTSTADTDSGASDESDDDAGDDHDDGDDDADASGDESAANSGGPPPADEVRLGGSGGTVIITKDCIDPPTGLVIIDVEDAEPDQILTVTVNGDDTQLQVGPEGIGRQATQTTVEDPTTVTVEIGGSVRSGQLTGC